MCQRISCQHRRHERRLECGAESEPLIGAISDCGPCSNCKRVQAKPGMILTLERCELAANSWSRRRRRCGSITSRTARTRGQRQLHCRCKQAPPAEAIYCRRKATIGVGPIHHVVASQVRLHVYLRGGRQNSEKSSRPLDWCVMRLADHFQIRVTFDESADPQISNIAQMTIESSPGIASTPWVWLAVSGGRRPARNSLRYKLTRGCGAQITKYSRRRLTSASVSALARGLNGSGFVWAWRGIWERSAETRLR
jgi:hypothetical protein